MATYYTAPRHRAPPIQTPSYSQTVSEHDWDLISQSSYIFPDPESAEVSPTPRSAVSYSSTASFSEISVSELGSEGFSPFCTPEIDPPVTAISRPPRSSLPPSLKSRRQGQILRPDLPWSRQFDIQKTIPSDAESLNDTQQSISDTHTLPRSNSSFRHPLSRIPAKSSPDSKRRSFAHRRTPQYPMPFLSFFSSLLRVDESTLDLLVLLDSKGPVLFPAEDISEVDFDAKRETATPAVSHGVEKFVSTVADDSGEKLVWQGLLSFDVISVSEYNMTSISIN
ncbi:hypothetical protein Agabi119p4_7301 [Agaricus bisporus var. burnettii]|uniref:Uncharacterized protein n=1 Tax=Agaricus bisporus var. burnettii TaxID=192524 RepID=A0A8H7C7U2_AGABI|nr:hypothetical protein Agabi119p4_7301 [Agaricus bisporus var. burnettii]